MTYLIYRYLFHQFFINTEGIKPFAERCVNKYVNKAAVQKANVLTTYVTITKEEQAKRSADLAAYQQTDRMDDGSFVIKRRKAKGAKMAVIFAILCEIFMNYLSTLIFIQGDGLMFVLARWGIAIVLTLAAMLSTDAFLRSLLPEESVRVKGKTSSGEDLEDHKRNSERKRIISLIVSAICLVAFEICIIGVARKRAIDFEGGDNGDILYYGFILLSVALPIIAGYFKWDSEHHGKLYQNTLHYYKAQKLTNTLDLIVTANMKDVKSVVEDSIRRGWDVFSRFKIYKENYNRKRSIDKEILHTHYCVNAESFRNAALNHFGNEVKTILAALEANNKQL